MGPETPHIYDGRFYVAIHRSDNAKGDLIPGREPPQQEKLQANFRNHFLNSANKLSVELA